MAFSISTIAFCTILSSRAGIESGLCFLFSVFLGDIDSAQRLGLILAILEPLMESLDVSRGVPFVFLVRDAVHSRAGFLSYSSECRIQRFGRDHVPDRVELSLRILLGKFRYSVDLCGHSSSSSVSRLCFLQQIRHLVPPFPPVGTVAAPFGRPAVPHLHRYLWGRKTALPSVLGRLRSPLAAVFPPLSRGDGELSWVHGKSLWKHAPS